MFVMRIFRIKVAAFLIALFALAVGPFLGTAAAAGKIALVTDLGGRGDLSFNDMGFKGADEASAAFDMELVGIQSNSATDYLPNLQNAARAGDFDIIIGVGFLLADAMAEVAGQFPDQKFAIIDVT